MTAMPAAIPQGSENDPGYQLRLAEETHEAVEIIKKRLFIGNGDPPLVVQVIQIKDEQEAQRKAQEEQKKIADKVREDLDVQMRSMIAVQKTLTTITDFFTKVGYTLLCAIGLAILGFIWALITHAITVGP